MNTFSKTLYLSLSLAAATASAAPAFSCRPTDEDHIGRPDDHTPISVMGDHTHSKDGWMFSYRYMNMQMGGMRNGTDRVAANEVFAADGGYTVTPEWMTMEMHMIGAMLAPTDKLTVMAMGNYTETEMRHKIFSQMGANMINNGERKFTTESAGFGDLKASALYRFYLKENRKAHFGLGISVPTGSIDKKDDLPGMGGPARRQMPAPMQLGSGTFDLLPSLTFVQQFEDWSWGSQVNGVVRLEGENSNGYRLGHRFEWVSWGGRNLTEWLGLTGGLSYHYEGTLDGDQDGVGTMGPNGRSVTTAFKDNYGGERIDLIFGINLLKPTGALKGHRLALDVRLPLWQDLNGYQLERDSIVTIGWQKAF